MIPADHATFREAARKFLAAMERIDMESVQGKDVSTERNRKLFDPIAPELFALLDRMPARNDWRFISRVDLPGRRTAR